MWTKCRLSRLIKGIQRYSKHSHLWYFLSLFDKYILVAFDVAICDIVHDVEIVYGLNKLLVAFGYIF